MREGPWWLQPPHEYPRASNQINSVHFSSDHQVLTLALAAGPEVAPLEHAMAEWRAAREVVARIAVHVGTGPMGRLGKLQVLGRASMFGPDTR